jgi:hypothetical protein
MGFQKQKEIGTADVVRAEARQRQRQTRLQLAGACKAPSHPGHIATEDFGVDPRAADTSACTVDIDQLMAQCQL